MKIVRWINRHPRQWICAVAVFMAAALEAGLWWELGGVWELACVIVAAIAAVWGWHAAAARESRDVTRELEERCDPEPLLAYSRARKRLCHPDRARERNAWIAALHELGQTGEAELLWAEVETWMGQSVSLGNQAAFAQWKAALCLDKKQPDAALPWIQQGERVCERLTEGRDEFAATLQIFHMIYEYLTQGCSQATLDMAAQQLETAKTRCSQVKAHWNTAVCLLELHRPEEARPHLEFVVAYGNKLAIRTRAETYLAALAAE